METRILDYQENQLSPAEGEAVEIHLAGCAGCRAFARQLQQLDEAFTSGMKVPALSTDFSRRLRERIQAVPPVLTAAQRAERKRQLQDEFETGIARIRPWAFAPISGLNHLVLPGLALVAGWLTGFFTSQLAAHLSDQSLYGLSPDLLPWLAGSVVFLIVVAAEAFPRSWRFFQV